MCEQEHLSLNTPIIVLGGKGFIGRRVIRMLNGRQVISIDIVDGLGVADWPAHLFGERVIVVNITVKSELDKYLGVMWPGTIVLNETYPEPSAATLNRLTQEGCVCYHVVGVRAHALPPFPEAYRGAIPCCAAWPSEDMDVIVRKLNCYR